jgi:methionine-rich copper-binding protein CopC
VFGIPTVVLRIIAVGWGLLLLAVGGCDLLEPRARLVESTPPAGAVLETPPAAVLLRFDEPLGGQSHLRVRSTITLSPAGEQAFGSGPEFTANGPDRSDPDRRTLRVELPANLPGGLYWVSWRTGVNPGRATRYGQYCFSVGMPIPESILAENPGGKTERDTRQRQRTGAIAGGLIFLALAAMIRKRS